LRQNVQGQVIRNEKKAVKGSGVRREGGKSKHAGGGQGNAFTRVHETKAVGSQVRQTLKVGKLGPTGEYLAGLRGDREKKAVRQCPGVNSTGWPPRMAQLTREREGAGKTRGSG